MAPVGMKEIPNPSTVDAQKSACKQELEKQFKEAIVQIEGQREATKNMLRQSAQRQKDQFTLQAGQQLEAKKAHLDHNLNQQILKIQEAAMQHRRMLEEKAAAVTLDYQHRKAHEDLLMQQYQLQQQFMNNGRRLEKEFRGMANSTQSSPTKASPGSVQTNSP